MFQPGSKNPQAIVKLVAVNRALLQVSRAGQWVESHSSVQHTMIVEYMEISGL